MPIISIVVLSILFGSTLLIFILAIAKSFGNKKADSIEEKPIEITKEPIALSTEEDFDEIAAAIAAIEAFRGDSSTFKVRRVIRQSNGSIIWNQAGVKQNNSSFL